MEYYEEAKQLLVSFGYGDLVVKDFEGLVVKDFPMPPALDLEPEACAEMPEHGKRRGGSSFCPSIKAKFKRRKR